jgi:heme o synthase
MQPRPLSIYPIVSLARPTLSLFVSFSAFSVYLYFRNTIDLEAFFLFSGVFLLSCAASALNQIQERHIDAIMERTRARPLPSMQLTMLQTTLFSASAGLLGLGLLFLGTNTVAALFGAVSLFFYNLVYTPLKKRTALALFPGAIAGSLPVLIGCSAATGRIEAKAVYIAIFAFLWQVPHFLLLLLRHKDDYERADIPTLLSKFSAERLRIIIDIWVLAACAATTIFPILRIVRSVPLVAVVTGLNICMVVQLFFSFRGRGKTGLTPAGALYSYQAIVFIVLIAQGIIER